MPLVEKSGIVEKLCPPFDHLLASQLIDEFVSIERRFIQRDWEPAELDGGQFAEVAARILYHQDSGTLNHGKELKECLDYIDEEGRKHLLVRRDAKHISKVLSTVYKFRSQRGAVHISPSYKANHMDSKFVIECVRWVMNELLRMFWNGDREKVAKAIRELLQFDVPAVGVFEEVLLVQRTDLSTEEEVLVLLHFAGEGGFNRNELGRHVRKSPASITTAIQRLVASECRQVVQIPNGNFRLTDLGARRVREHLADKLLLQ